VDCGLGISWQTPSDEKKEGLNEALPSYFLELKGNYGFTSY